MTPDHWSGTIRYVSEVCWEGGQSWISQNQSDLTEKRKSKLITIMVGNCYEMLSDFHNCYESVFACFS